MTPTRLLPALLAFLLLPVPNAPAGRETLSTTSASDARRAALVSFCRKHRGRKVGTGDCWSLANEAFKATGAQRPGRDCRVWGRQLDLRRESPLPGDILECDRSRFSDGSYVPKQHTAIILDVHSATVVRIAEQNYGYKKKVTERELALSPLRGGSIAIYRPL